MQLSQPYRVRPCNPPRKIEDSNPHRVLADGDDFQGRLSTMDAIFHPCYRFTVTVKQRNHWLSSGAPAGLFIHLDATTVTGSPLST